jgi:ATP-dependent helicase Lhr and Lhr-like helicase
VRRQLELPLHFGTCETERFELSHPLGIGAFPSLPCLPLFLLAFFHTLGEAGLRVDEAFSGVTHVHDYSMHNARYTMPKVVRDSVELFHPAVREWFTRAFTAPTRPQQLGWPAIARGESTLILAPTGSGKTLTAFLWCLNRLMFEAVPPRKERCRVLYISPLKALAVDVERNLRAPLAGIGNIAAAAGTPVNVPDIAIRTGDTPASDRTRFLREPADILITTPESLFLLLTSQARERLASVDTVIIDEIHALVPGKRGAHLALSLERLEALRAMTGPPAAFAPGAPAPTKAGHHEALQRIGLSATQRPLEEVARFLGGAEPRAVPRHRRTAKRKGRPKDVPLENVEAELHDEFGVTDHGNGTGDTAPARYRPVTVINAAEKKQLKLRIEVPVEDMARIAAPAVEVPSGPAGQSSTRTSIWASIHPRLLELIRSHQSTLLFVNSRRLAERLAGALNELAGEPLVRSHHGSLARAARSEVEDLLKAGRIRALVATSSLELGIDMGAIDLVVQIEAPPSVASGLQRIGRAGHQAGAVSEGIIFPKFRGDLVACAAVSRAMHEGKVESTRYPRNPLDVLAQQIVAMAGMDPWPVDELYSVIRRAAPFADLSRRMFEGVLDMLSGRYPSDEFAELRPRVTWDRVQGTLVGREGAKRVAIANAGTIPDRGLYGVFLAGADRPVRVGELDEEMVFETQVGETFTLGASTWRIEEITHDRVLVTPAPGEPGKMPFWHGDQAGRPIELGYAIGALVRELRGVPRAAAIERLVRQHDLDPTAAENVLRYLDDQAAAGAVPDDRTVVIERCLDELGDWRVCLLSPLGSRIHAPWAMAATAQIRNRTGIDVEVMWGDEGFVIRFPEVESAPDPALLLPDADEVEGLVLRQLGATSLFAARFRETAARALLLPRRRPGARTPLWQQRKRASDLLAVASRFGSFPALLETYREVLRDHFDMPALVDTLRKLSSRSLRLSTIDSRVPSPFAASLLFSYVANYIYDGDAPLAERRAQALSVDQAQLRELLGDAELRELLDPEALASIERQLQHLDEKYKVRTVDGLHDLLIRIGDLTVDELQLRSSMADVTTAVTALERARRIIPMTVGGDRRYIAVEDVARYRDALGIPLPSGLPESLLEPVRDPAGDLVLRYARSHGPFTAHELATRYGLGVTMAESILLRLTEAGRLIEGEFRPGGTEREWVDADVLRSLRRRSLAALRQEIEPVSIDSLGRFLLSWHGIGTGRHGLEPLLDAIEQLQGAAIPASMLEREVLPARVLDYQPGMLDTLMAAGEVVWVGVEPLGERDGRIAVFLTDHMERLRPPATTPPALEGRSAEILDYLREHGASFFAALHQGTGGGFPQETVDALWDLVWQGVITNDTLHPLRAYSRTEDKRSARRERHRGFRSRRLVPPAAEGRWSLVPATRVTKASSTDWAAAMAQQLLTRHGIVTRETVAAEAVAGGFTAVYDVLKAMEDTGRVRRGYFVAGLGAAQFAMPAALDLLRSMRDASENPRTVIIAATDPANPYGSIVKWPQATTPGVGQGLEAESSRPTPDVRPSAAAGSPDVGRGPTRSVGALVILVDGAAAGYLRRGERELLLFLPEPEPQRSQVGHAVAHALVDLSNAREPGRRGMLLAEINGTAAGTHPAARLFVESGFQITAMGLQARPQPVAQQLRQTHVEDTMADKNRDRTAQSPQSNKTDNDLNREEIAPDDRDAEQDRVRSSNDRDQALEREGVTSPHNRGYDEAVKGERSQPTDPDSAESDIDRDDTVEE